MIEYIFIGCSGLFLGCVIGYALGVWAHVMTGRIETETRARRMASMLMKREQEVKRKWDTIKAHDLPMSTSEDEKQQEQYAPELKQMLGMEDHGKTS